MIINESRTVNLGNGSSAYSYGGKYYIKKGDTKKEISKDQYDKLLSKGGETGSQSSNKKDKDKYLKPGYGWSKVYIGGKKADDFFDHNEDLIADISDITGIPSDNLKVDDDWRSDLSKAFNDPSFEVKELDTPKNIYGDDELGTWEEATSPEGCKIYRQTLDGEYIFYADSRDQGKLETQKSHGGRGY